MTVAGVGQCLYCLAAPRKLMLGAIHNRRISIKFDPIIAPLRSFLPYLNIKISCSAVTEMLFFSSQTGRALIDP